MTLRACFVVLTIAMLIQLSIPARSLGEATTTSSTCPKVTVRVPDGGSGQEKLVELTADSSEPKALHILYGQENSGMMSMTVTPKAGIKDGTDELTLNPGNTREIKLKPGPDTPGLAMFSFTYEPLPSGCTGQHVPIDFGFSNSAKLSIIGNSVDHLSCSCDGSAVPLPIRSSTVGDQYTVSVQFRGLKHDLIELPMPLTYIVRSSQADIISRESADPSSKGITSSFTSNGSPVEFSFVPKDEWAESGNIEVTTLMSTTQGRGISECWLMYKSSIRRPYVFIGILIGAVFYGLLSFFMDAKLDHKAFFLKLKSEWISAVLLSLFTAIIAFVFRDQDIVGLKAEVTSFHASIILGIVAALIGIEGILKRVKQIFSGNSGSGTPPSGLGAGGGPAAGSGGSPGGGKGTGPAVVPVAGGGT
jgi:hypothetical protein